MDSLPESGDLVEMRIDLPDDQMMIMQPFGVIENPMGQPLILEDSTLNDISLLSHSERGDYSQKRVTIYPQTIVLNVANDNESFNSKNKKAIELGRVGHKVMDVETAALTSLVCAKITEDKERHLTQDMSNDKKGVCPFCMKYFMLDRMERHIKFVHKNEKTKCDKCNKSFKDIFQHKKLRHEIYYHGKGSRLKCKFCGKLFRKELDCKDHIKRDHHKDMQTPSEKSKIPCMICGALIMAVPPNSVWESHIYPQHMIESAYSTCPIGNGCLFTLPHNIYIKKHLASVHSVTATQLLVCDVCPKRFFTAEEKEKHIKLEHPHNNIKCKYCGQTFVFHKALAVHYYEQHMNALVSDIFESGNDAIKYPKTKVTKYILSKDPLSGSKKQVATVKDLYVTNNILNKLDTNKKNIVHQPGRDEKASTGSKEVLVQQSQPSNLNEKIKVKPVSKPNEKCLEIVGLEKHITNKEPLISINYDESEHISKPYNIELKSDKMYNLGSKSQLECGQIAMLGVDASIDNLDEVSSLIENEDQSSPISMHIDSVSTESTRADKSENLEVICIEEAQDPLKQNATVQIKSPDVWEQNEKFSCPFQNCTSTLANISSLKEHLTRHDIEEIPCEEPGCKKICKNKRLFREHMQYHERTKAGPAKCTWDGCNHVAKNKTVLEKSHIRKVHHGKNYWKKGEKRTKCLKCDSVMLRKSLKQHMARYHSGQSLRSNCEICNKLVTSQNMKMHIKMAHTTDTTSCQQCGKIALNLNNHKCSKNKIQKMNVEEKQFKYVILKQDRNSDV